MIENIKKAILERIESAVEDKSKPIKVEDLKALAEIVMSFSKEEENEVEEETENEVGGV